MAKQLNGELRDNSGPYDPSRKREDFTKEFLIKLMDEYCAELFKMAEFSRKIVEEWLGADKAIEFELELWAKRWLPVCRPRIAKLTGIKVPVKDIVEAMKVYQVTPDSMVGSIYDAKYEVVTPNHVIMTTTHCGTLEWFERNAPERIVSCCHTVEVPIIQADLGALNPNIKIKALKLPPRKSKDEIACQWEVKLEE